MDVAFLPVEVVGDVKTAPRAVVRGRLPAADVTCSPVTASGDCFRVRIDQDMPGIEAIERIAGLWLTVHSPPVAQLRADAAQLDVPHLSGAIDERVERDLQQRMMNS